MQIAFTWEGSAYRFALDHPLDISIPLESGARQPNAFHAPPYEYSPVKTGDFTGLVSAGSPVNFLNLHINPHGNGTHTEGIGHITPEIFPVRECLPRFHFLALLLSVEPSALSNGDRVIGPEPLQAFADELEKYCPEAVIVRTLPNPLEKKTRNYSDSNPPYFLPEATAWLCGLGVLHLLTDLPSVDREQDGGRLAAHKAFWLYPDSPRKHSTITEMVFVPDEVADGFYLLNLQILNLDTDASPSRPVLFPTV